MPKPLGLDPLVRRQGHAAHTGSALDLDVAIGLSLQQRRDVPAAVLLLDGNRLAALLDLVLLDELDGDGLDLGIAFHALDRRDDFPRRRQDHGHAHDLGRLFRKVRFLLDLLQPGLEPVRELGLACLFLRRLPCSESRLGSFSSRIGRSCWSYLAIFLTDSPIKILERLADVLFLDAQARGRGAR